MATYSSSVPPVIRLYQAFFQRLPDESGLAYWTGRLRAGRPLADAATAFAGSGDFARDYGSLTNAQFVDLVYQHVLGRPGDASGRAYWVKQLDDGSTRGKVMASFSESSEFTTDQREAVDIVGVYHALLKVVPSTIVVAYEKTQFQGGGSLGALADRLLGSIAYLHTFGIDPPCCNGPQRSTSPGLHRL